MSTIILWALFSAGAEPAARLLVMPAAADRGDVKAGAAISQEFQLRNAGATPLTISEMVGSCGCARPRVSKKDLPPGESAVLTVEVNTLAAGAGAHAWRVTVRFEHGPPGRRVAGECEAVVRARVVREIEVEPVALFLSADREVSHTVRVTDRRPRPLTVTGARCESKHVKLELDTDKAGHGSQSVRVTVLDACPPGHFSEQVILTTDDPEYPQLRVPLTIARKAPGQVLAAPEQIDLRLAKGQKTASGLVRLRDPEGRPVVVERIKADHPGVRFKWAAGPGPTTTVRLGVELEGRAAGLGTVTITLKEPGPQVLVVPVSWQAP